VLDDSTTWEIARLHDVIKVAGEEIDCAVSVTRLRTGYAPIPGTQTTWISPQAPEGWVREIVDGTDSATGQPVRQERTLIAFKIIR
jgi:hypothetical protein